MKLASSVLPHCWNVRWALSAYLHSGAGEGRGLGTSLVLYSITWPYTHWGSFDDTCSFSCVSTIVRRWVAAGWTMMPRGEDRPKVHTDFCLHTGNHKHWHEKGVFFKHSCQVFVLYLIPLGNKVVWLLWLLKAHSPSSCEYSLMTWPPLMSGHLGPPPPRLHHYSE